MSLADFIERIKASPAHWHTRTELPDPAATENGQPAAYFQVRLSDMYLSDRRRWQFEIVPAAFFLVDYHYAKEPVRHPFFVSNKLLTGLPSEIGAKPFPVRFRNTLVLGPTPYSSGDVTLFVGLFQSAIEDRRATLFSVFETLFGSLPVGALPQYLKLANKLSGDIARMLGMQDIQCLLADHSPINSDNGAAPRQRYLAYLRSKEGKPDVEGLEVHDGSLYRKRQGRVAPVEDLDYCLLRIEQMATRNDYTSMDFHETWSKARIKVIEKQPQEAQALMLTCAQQVLVSPDLTEDHKLELIKFYQAKLLAAQVILDSAPGANAATRSAERVSRVGMMRTRADKVHVESGTLGTPIAEIGKLVQEMVRKPSAAPATDGDRAGRFPPLSDEDIACHLCQQPAGGKDSSPELLLKALTVGSVN